MSAVAEPLLLDTIAGTVASTLKIPLERLDVDADFDSFGMDSIIAIELMTNLSKQLKISITPAQLTAVHSIRELAGTIDAAIAAPVAAPAAKAPATAVARPAAIAPARPPVVARRRPGHRPAYRPDADVARLLGFVDDEYGIDLRGERFTSKDALIEHLLAHHADALSHYYGLIGEEGAAEDARIDASPMAMPVGAPDIAVIGMACQFADAGTPAVFWRGLSEERSSIRPLDGDRWSGAQSAEALSTPRWGARIDEIDMFDAEFFGLSEDEAMMCDPQERLVMQSLYHALQHAGIRASGLRGSRTALFLGYEYAEYEHHLRRNLHRIPSAPAFSSSSPIYYLANRISFLFDLKGPSEVVNASCASSALAIHRARLALAQGECDLAICGGVSLNLFADDYAAIARYGLLSPDGRCAVFDEEANGFTRGEGLGLLVLKRLDDAERDNHRIFAKIVATHQNNRGRAAFISEIKHEAITQVIGECYEKHSIAPDSVRYIEVDGYATKWGDSFEFEGIRNAFQPVAEGGKSCALGSAKGNIGHVEPASGVASAIKVALSLHHGRFPATITKKKLSAFIDIESGSHPLYIADRALPFEELRRRNEPIRAGVNSFSDSGVNVHLVFEEYRGGPDAASAIQSAGQGRAQLYVFSARTRDSLLRHLDAYTDLVEAGIEARELENLAYTTQLIGEPMEHRVAIVANGAKALLDALARARRLVADGKSSDGSGPVFVGSTRREDGDRTFDVIQSQIGDDRLLDNIRAGQLKEIALLWTSGIDMPWGRYWREVVLARRRQGQCPPQLIDVPLYPFAKKRYWIDVDDMANPVAPTSAPTETDRSASPAQVAQDTRRWRFVDRPADGERAEALDAEDKIRLFLGQEVACILGVAQEDLHEDLNFLQLGFNSVGMTALIERTIHLLGVNISPSLVFTHPDIASLGRYLGETHRDRIDRIHAIADASAGAPPAGRRGKSGRGKSGRDKTARSDLETWFVDRDSASGSLIVPMQTNATGTPVFAVPGADGSILSLQTLSRAMDGISPMFGFQAVGLDGTREPLASIDEIAEANIEALAAMRDARRLSLVGHSNGAVVAFEMARRLLRKKVRVDRLVLVDCRCPGFGGREVEQEISEAFVNVINALGGERQLDVEEFSRVPEDERAEYLYTLIQNNGFGTPKEQFMLAYRLSLANERACRAYLPRKIGSRCETVVVRATQSNGGQPADLGWNKFLARPATCLEIDADHLSVVGAEGSAVIAEIFR